MNFDEAISALSSLAPRGWRMGLDRMSAFMSEAGLEPALGSKPGPQYIHVAGTNGKGSVTAYLQSLFVEQGYRTGAFFSPYVYDPRERIQFGRELIGKEDFARLTESLLSVADRLEGTEFGGVTEFELKTAMGFAFYLEQKCEWVALEVGLGGRLDATNVVTPRASVIVSIGMDHMNVLGNSIAEIAFEKAGVCKPGVPLIVGSMPPEARDVIVHQAEEVGAPIWRFNEEILLSKETDGSYSVETPLSRFESLRPSLVGVHQPHNMALAVSALEAAGALQNASALGTGVSSAILPGRFERRTWRNRTWILDGAHNVDSANAVADTLGQEYPNQTVKLITGMLSGHEPSDFYRILAPITDSALFVPVDFHRTRDPRDLASEVGSLFRHSSAMDSVAEAIEAAVESTPEGGIILVAGSFYLVGEAGALLAEKSRQDAPVPK